MFAHATTVEAETRGKRRRRRSKPDDRLELAVRRLLDPKGPRRLPAARRRLLERRWLRATRSLKRLGSFSSGNRITAMTDGAEAFPAMWEAIDGATSRVWLETYTLEQDRVGRRTMAALLRAARRGCDVLLIHDAIGSRGLGAAFLDSLRRSGGRVIAFNPLLTWRHRSPLAMRDHRKVLVVDDRAGFCGGMNLSEDYAAAPLGNGRFRDVHLMVEGPAVHDLALIVMDTFEDATGEHRTLERPLATDADGVLVQVLGSNTRRNVRSIQRALRCALSRAVHRCWLTTPYFVPPVRLRRAIERAARRGVDVRLITAGDSDVPFSWLAARHVYPRLLRAGVRIWELDGQVIHTKRASVDQLFGMLGSFNLDHWSDRRNLEVVIVTLDRTVADELDKQFENDLADAREVKRDDHRRQPFYTRAAQWLAYQAFRI